MLYVVTGDNEFAWLIGTVENFGLFFGEEPRMECFVCHSFFLDSP